MSHEALIEDLRQKSADRIKHMQAEAEEKVAELRRKKQQEFEQYRAEVLSKQAGEAERIAAPILHEAQRMALATEDEAMHRLVKRLYALAEGMISQARGADFEPVFAGLVHEVPAVPWETVRVNPADEELAAKYFPQSRIESDPDIIGGFVASTDGGKYQVVNTLKRRLEKGWVLILPELLKEITEVNVASPAP